MLPKLKRKWELMMESLIQLGMHKVDRCFLSLALWCGVARDIRNPQLEEVVT